VADVERKDRDDAGKFVKGHKVPSPRTGRPTRGDTMPVLIAITQAAYSAEELVKMIRDTYEMAEEEKDWKGMFTVINFIAQYAVGKPVQRSLVANIDPGKLRELFGVDTDDAARSDGAIEGELGADNDSGEQSYSPADIPHADSDLPDADGVAV
jgi:hypothetical protein